MFIKWKEYLLETMIPTIPIIFMLISGIIFSWDVVADGTPRLVAIELFLIACLDTSGWLLRYYEAHPALAQADRRH
ncbi:hypothetical protein CspeluHIS016_0602840 [Cutaneotrichosporon spelunceum]|uniref:Uncharacterized protein n=1 Tax=Cutaneotrichosporon spelunceum TaxID=1672016 RepID=A0AAD3TYP8_9TREE|nr:hypothetical protein CspeluHIS016_0602840 [Cutaneotrichosporon spelunceum]